MNYSDVSVIIPYFNSHRTIKRTLESIANQTVKPEKVIIIDDCSSTNSFNKLNLIANSFNVIDIDIYKMDKNQGPGRARNFVWSLVKTKFIAFLDADDSWYPPKLEIQLSYFSSDHLLVLCGHLLDESYNYTKDDKNITNNVCKHINKKDILFKNYFQTPSVMLRTDIVQRFNNSRYAEDQYLWMDIILSGQKAVFIEKELGCCHKAFFGVGGLSNNLWKMEVGEIKNIIYFCKKYKVNAMLFLSSVLFSVIKYIRRVIKSRF